MDTFVTGVAAVLIGGFILYKVIKAIVVLIEEVEPHPPDENDRNEPAGGGSITPP